MTAKVKIGHRNIASKDAFCDVACSHILLGFISNKIYVILCKDKIILI